MSLIAADSSAPVLLEHGIVPDLVVTDLDGFSPDVAPRGIPLVVHAHGDNISRLPAVSGLDVCLGTAQTAPTGWVLNFGGFTDGDRAVFLASALGARDIVLCGMDLAGPVTTSSGDPRTKLEKLRVAADLLEWLATFTESKLYTTSQPLRGFCSVTGEELRDMAKSAVPPGPL